MSVTVDFLNELAHSDDGSHFHLILEGQELPSVGGWFGSTNPFVVVSASVPSIYKSAKIARWKRVHSSEVIPNIGEDSRPRWKEMIIPLHALCKGELQKPIRIAVQSQNEGSEDTPMGYLDTTVNDLLQVSGDPEKTAALRNEANSETECGCLLVRHARIQRPRLSARQSTRNSMSLRSFKSNGHNPRRDSLSTTRSTTISRSLKKRRPSIASHHSKASIASSHHSRASTKIPEELLEKETSVLRLTLEANLTPVGASGQLTTLVEGVFGGENFSLPGLSSLWGGSTDKKDDIKDPMQNDDDDDDIDEDTGWLEATENLLSCTNPYFQISSLSYITEMTTDHHHNVGDEEGSVISNLSSATRQWKQHVYRSEPILDTVTPIWKVAEVPLYLLCGGDLERKFRISIFSEKDGLMGGTRAHGAPMGHFDTTVMELKQASIHNKDFVLKSKDGAKKYGTVRVLEATLPELLELDIDSDVDSIGGDENSISEYWGRDHDSISEITGITGKMGLLGHSSYNNGQKLQKEEEKEGGGQGLKGTARAAGQTLPREMHGSDGEEKDKQDPVVKSSRPEGGTVKDKDAQGESLEKQAQKRALYSAPRPFSRPREKHQPGDKRRLEESQPDGHDTNQPRGGDDISHDARSTSTLGEPNDNSSNQTESANEKQRILLKPLTDLASGVMAFLPASVAPEEKGKSCDENTEKDVPRSIAVPSKRKSDDMSCITDMHEIHVKNSLRSNSGEDNAYVTDTLSSTRKLEEKKATVSVSYVNNPAIRDCQRQSMTDTTYTTKNISSSERPEPQREAGVDLLQQFKHTLEELESKDKLADTQGGQGARTSKKQETANAGSLRGHAMELLQVADVLSQRVAPSKLDNEKVALETTLNNNLLNQIAELSAQLQMKDNFLMAVEEKAEVLSKKTHELEARLRAKDRILDEANAKVAYEDVRLAEASVADECTQEKKADAFKIETLVGENKGLVEDLMKSRTVAEDTTAELQETSLVVTHFEDLVEELMKSRAMAEDNAAKLRETSLLMTHYEEENGEYLKHKELWEEERVNLADKVTKLEFTIDTSHGRIEELERQLERASGDNTLLERARQESDTTIEGLRHELDHMSGRMNPERLNAERMDNHEQSLETRLAEKSTLARRELESLLFDCENALRTSQEKVRADAVRISEMSAQIDGLNQQISTLREQSIKTSASSETKELLHLQVENVKIQKSLEDAQEAARSCKQALVEAQKEALMLDESVKARERLVEKAEEELTRLKKEKELEIENLKEENKRVSSNVGKAFELTLAQAAAKIEMHETKSVDDDSKITELSSQNMVLKERLMQLERMMEEKTQAIIKFGTTMKSRDTLVEELQCEMSTLRVQLNHANAEKETVMSACRAMESELKRFEETKTAAAALEDEVKDLRQKVPVLEEQAQNLILEQSQARQRAAELEALLQSKESEVQRQREVIEELQRSTTRSSTSDDEDQSNKLLQAEKERDAEVENSKKLEKKVEELFKELQGAKFAKAIYEKQWKDANARIAKLKHNEEEAPKTRKSIMKPSTRRKTIRKSVKPALSEASEGTQEEVGARKSRSSKVISSELQDLTDDTAQADENKQNSEETPTRRKSVKPSTKRKTTRKSVKPTRSEANKDDKEVSTRKSRRSRVVSSGTKKATEDTAQADESQDTDIC